MQRVYMANAKIYLAYATYLLIIMQQIYLAYATDDGGTIIIVINYLENMNVSHVVYYFETCFGVYKKVNFSNWRVIESL